MGQKSILTAKEAVRLGPDDYVMVNCGGGLRRMRVRELEKLLRAPVPDAMYDFRGGDNSAADRETVKDLAGGNDATIVNCAFNATGSGYGNGGLQLDGVDDYVKMPEGCRGFKTVFMECSPAMSHGDIMYDQRGTSSNYWFAIYNEQADKPAYASRNNGGKVYINGQDNESAGWTGADLQSRRHLITITNDNATEANTKGPVIGGGNSDFQAKMTVYRFLGYKRVLTEAEIKAVIEGYGLLEECEGVNLLKGTATFDPAYIGPNYAGSAVWSINGKHAGLDVKTTAIPRTTSFYGFKSDVLAPTHFPTVISFYARVTKPDPSGKTVTFACYTGRKQDGNAKSMDGGSAWKQYFLYAENGFDFSDAETDGSGNGFVEFSSAVATIEVCGLKVERVNPDLATPTPWTPAFGEKFPDGFDAGQLEGGVNNFDSSLVDAWIFSGHTNAEAPATIAGEKGTALTCRNFAWTAQSGFDGQGNLTFDGVDDFLINEDMELLDDFTVIVNRELDRNHSNSCTLSKSADVSKGAFIMEVRDGGTGFSVYSYGKASTIISAADGPLFMTPNSYNGNTIQRGTADDTPELVIGTIRKNDANRFFKGRMKYAALYRRSLTEEEIAEAGSR